MPRETALIVPVPEAEAAVGELRAQHDWAAARGVPAHITILYPFAPPDEIDEAAIAEVLAPFGSFEFELASLEHWDEPVTYLAPVPAEPFGELTNAVWARWPTYPPYEGAHDVVVPHLTVGNAHLEPELELPIACRAREVTLIEEADDGRCGTRRSYPLA
jgi:hypothetical protein